MTVCGSLLSRPLSGAKRKGAVALHMSANDPKRTSTRDKAKLGVRAVVVSNGIARPQLHPIQSRCPEGREFQGSCS
jgi:hypothetical protein